MIYKRVITISAVLILIAGVLLFLLVNPLGSKAGEESLRSDELRSPQSLGAPEPSKEVRPVRKRTRSDRISLIFKDRVSRRPLEGVQVIPLKTVPFPLEEVDGGLLQPSAEEPGEEDEHGDSMLRSDPSGRLELDLDVLSENIYLVVWKQGWTTRTISTNSVQVEEAAEGQSLTIEMLPAFEGKIEGIFKPNRPQKIGETLALLYSTPLTISELSLLKDAVSKLHKGVFIHADGKCSYYGVFSKVTSFDFRTLDRKAIYKIRLILGDSRYIPYDIDSNLKLSSPYSKLTFVSPMVSLCKPRNDVVIKGMVDWFISGKYDMKYAQAWDRSSGLSRVFGHLLKKRLEFENPGYFAFVKVPKDPESWLGRNFVIRVKSFGHSHGWQRYRAHARLYCEYDKPEIVKVAETMKRRNGFLVVDLVDVQDRPAYDPSGYTVNLPGSASLSGFTYGKRYEWPAGTYRIYISSFLDNAWVKNIEATKEVVIRGRETTHFKVVLKWPCRTLTLKYLRGEGGPLEEGLLSYGFASWDRKIVFRNMVELWPFRETGHLKFSWPKGTFFNYSILNVQGKRKKGVLSPWNEQPFSGEVIVRF